jgi:hypothetical protein
MAYCDDRFDCCFLSSSSFLFADAIIFRGVL